MSQQGFVTTDVLRLEVEDDPTGLSNLVQNPSGTLGGWGWLTPVTGSTMRGDTSSGTQALTYVAAAGGVANYFTTENMPIAAGQYAAAVWQIGTINGYYRARFEWVNSAGSLISSSTQTGYLNATGTGSLSAVVAPALTAYVRLRFDHYSTNTGTAPTAGQKIIFSEATVAKAATSGALAGLAYIDPAAYFVDVLGPTHDIKVVREALNVGTLSATILDATLDPSQDDLIRPGRRTRLMSYDQTYIPPVTTVRTNRVPNPSFETNTTGWSVNAGSAIARVTSPAGQSGSACASLTRSGSTGLVYTYLNPNPAFVAGQTYTLSVYARAATTARTAYLSIDFLNSGGGYVDGYYPSALAGETNSGWTRLSWTFTVPAGTTTQGTVSLGFNSAVVGEVHYIDAVLLEQAGSAGTYFDGSTADAGGVDYEWTGTAHASTSTATTTVTPGYYDDVWEPLFTGKVVEASVTYDLKDPNIPEQKRARIVLTAVDANADLSNQKRNEGVLEIGDLPYVLEGCGVPWNTDGYGGQAGVTTVVAYNDNASALDQIAITRDTNLGYAWVDRYGVIQVWGDVHDSDAQSFEIYPSAYTDLDLSFNTQDCINEVTIKFLRLNPTTGETEEVPYGPYRNETSITEWGVRSATFTIQGLSEETSDIPDLADAILAANADPQVVVNSLTVPVTESGSITPGFASDLDLYTRLYPLKPGMDEISPSYPADYYPDVRVTRVEHSITPDKWLIKFGFAADGVIASPTFVPSPQTGAGGLTIGQLLRPVGEITMFGSATAPDGWLTCDGDSVLVADYPRLFDVIGYTFGGAGASFNLPNFTDRFPIGTGTKAIGTSGGDATKTIGANNLPTHTHPAGTLANANESAHTHGMGSVAVGSTSSATGGNTSNIARGTATNTGTISPLTGSSGAGSAHTHTISGSTGNNTTTATALDVMNPWRAIHFIIRAV